MNHKITFPSTIDDCRISNGAYSNLHALREGRPLQKFSNQIYLSVTLLTVCLRPDKADWDPEELDACEWGRSSWEGRERRGEGGLRGLPQVARWEQAEERQRKEGRQEKEKEGMINHFHTFNRQYQRLIVKVKKAARARHFPLSACVAVWS